MECQAWRMQTLVNQWKLAYRRAAYWLAALVAGLIFGSVTGEAGGLLFIVLFVPTMVIATVALVIRGVTSSWRLRGTGVHAIVPAITPFAAIAIGALVFVGIWSIRGTPPLVEAGTDDVEINQTLSAPNGGLKAVILENLSGGPATGVSREIYIEQGPTSFFQYRDQVFSQECIQDLVARWIGPRTLSISYSVGYDDLKDDGINRPPFWVWHAAAREVKVVVVRRVVRQQSLCRR